MKLFNQNKNKPQLKENRNKTPITLFFSKVFTCFHFYRVFAFTKTSIKVKNILLVFFMVLFSFNAINAQLAIKGSIKDNYGKPLEGASIVIPELNTGVLADSNGYFQFSNLPFGKVQLHFSFIGYATKIEQVTPSANTIYLNEVLEETVIETDEVVVTGGYTSTQHDNAVKIDVLKMKDASNIPNLSAAVAKIPGIDMISKGSGLSKPVIRGLSMNDVLILNNNVRYENYQYSSHHPLGISEYGIDNVEVIKGPASLIYGSDAIGGVINFIKEKPAKTNTIEGDYHIKTYSNSLGLSNSLGIKGANEKFFSGIRIGHSTHSDYLQGKGNFVPNSRNNELTFQSQIGSFTNKGVFKVFYDFSREKIGLVEEEALDVIKNRSRKLIFLYQQLNTHLISSQNKIFLDRTKLDINVSLQNTDLSHLQETKLYEIEMKLLTLTYEAKLYLPSTDNSEYIIGFQGLSQKNSNLNNRQTILLPNAVSSNYSMFCLLQKKFHKLRVQTGLRYDYKKIDTKEVNIVNAFRAPVHKNYHSYSGSIGATYNFNQNILLRANLASAFRTPNLAELTSNGPHETRFEQGNASLNPEKSIEADLSFHLHYSNFTFEIAGFQNHVKNYIFIAPTNNFSQGLPLYIYKQENAVLKGTEIGFHFHPENLSWLHFESDFSYVSGKQFNGDYLPFVPAPKINLQARGTKTNLFFTKSSSLAILFHHAFDQNHPAPEESATLSYNLVDLESDIKLKTEKLPLAISFSVLNVFDEKYIDHLSTLKEVGLFNPGRNFIVALSLQF